MTMSVSIMFLKAVLFLVLEVTTKATQEKVSTHQPAAPSMYYLSAINLLCKPFFRDH